MAISEYEGRLLYKALYPEHGIAQVWVAVEEGTLCTTLLDNMMPSGLKVGEEVLIRMNGLTILSIARLNR